MVKNVPKTTTLRSIVPKPPKVYYTFRPKILASMKRSLDVEDVENAKKHVKKMELDLESADFRLAQAKMVLRNLQCLEASRLFEFEQVMMESEIRNLKDGMHFCVMDKKVKRSVNDTVLYTKKPCNIMALVLDSPEIPFSIGFCTRENDEYTISGKSSEEVSMKLLLDEGYFLYEDLTTQNADGTGATAILTKLEDYKKPVKGDTVTIHFNDAYDVRHVFVDGVDDVPSTVELYFQLNEEPMVKVFSTDDHTAIFCSDDRMVSLTSMFGVVGMKFRNDVRVTDANIEFSVKKVDYRM